MNKTDLLFELFTTCTGVVIDSRKIEAGKMFFALQGERVNGNMFAKSALEQGAAYAIIDDEAYKVDERYIVVDNTLGALQALAKKYRSTFTFPVIAITGSNGKTTTKELMHVVLNKKYTVFATEGNLNNHIGVPLSILSVKKECTCAIIEMGANHQKEIDFLCHIADPDYAFITNIGKAHLEGFGGYEGVKKGKSELYRYVMKKGGVLFVNTLHTVLNDVYQDYNSIVKYGIGEGNDVNGKIIPGETFAAVEVNNSVIIHSHLVGSYNADNILAAVCAGKFFGISENDIKQAIESYVPINNRSELKKFGGNYFIMDAYNANPSSVKAAIENFSTLSSPYKIAVLGDMLELGDYTDAEHASILNLALSKQIDTIITVGPAFEKLKNTDTHIHLNSAEDVRTWLDAESVQGAYILIKGSRKIGLEKVVS